MIKKNVQGSYHFELSNELNIFFLLLKAKRIGHKFLKEKTSIVLYMIYYDVVQLTSLTLFGEIELKY